jgi:hypothetical protein
LAPPRENRVHSACKWRTKTRTLPGAEAEKLKLRPDRSWEFDLEGCFGRVIVDEAHNIRNIRARATTAILWLNPGFTFF